MGAEGGQRGEGSTVPYGLHPRDRLLSLLKRVRAGPKAQHRSLYGAGLPLQPPLKGTQKVPHGAQATSPLTTFSPHVGGQDLRGPTEGRA